MLAGLLIGVLVFQFLFEQVNKLDLKFINKIQEKTRDLKKKKVIEYVMMFVLAGLLWGIMDMIAIGYIVQGLIVGIIWALIMFLFEDTIFDNMRNTLR